MNRQEWKAMSRAIRSHTRSIAELSRGRHVSRMRLDHGVTWFNVDHIREPGKPACIEVRPAIIRDRSVSSRIAAELEWSRYFRTRRDYIADLRQRNHNAARACIADARAIRLAASPFQGIPS